MNEYYMWSTEPCTWYAENLTEQTLWWLSEGTFIDYYVSQGMLVDSFPGASITKYS